MNIEIITLGGGCFWCLEASFQLLAGVEQVVPGYAGGTGDKPSYSTIHGSKDGWAETVQITFDPTVITFTDLLDAFWVIHDPTTPNRQGHDEGPEYRSMILYQNEQQKAEAEQSKNEAQKNWQNPIVTEIVPLESFFEAELEHHNYFINHPEQAYCQIVINPKLKKLREKFSARLKQKSV